MSDDWPKPEWRPLYLHCRNCGHDFKDWQPSGVRIKVWTATIEALACPKCGGDAGVLSIRRAPDVGFVA